MSKFLHKYATKLLLSVLYIYAPLDPSCEKEGLTWFMDKGRQMIVTLSTSCITIHDKMSIGYVFCKKYIESIKAEINPGYSILDTHPQCYPLEWIKIRNAALVSLYLNNEFEENPRLAHVFECINLVSEENLTQKGFRVILDLFGRYDAAKLLCNVFTKQQIEAYLGSKTVEESYHLFFGMSVENVIRWTRPTKTGFFSQFMQIFIDELVDKLETNTLKNTIDYMDRLKRQAGDDTRLSTDILALIFQHVCKRLKGIECNTYNHLRYLELLSDYYIELPLEYKWYHERLRERNLNEDDFLLFLHYISITHNEHFEERQSISEEREQEYNDLVTWFIGEKKKLEVKAAEAQKTALLEDYEKEKTRKGKGAVAAAASSASANTKQASKTGVQSIETADILKALAEIDTLNIPYQKQQLCKEEIALRCMINMREQQLRHVLHEDYLTTTNRMKLLAEEKPRKGAVAAAASSGASAKTKGSVGAKPLQQTRGAVAAAASSASANTKQASKTGAVAAAAADRSKTDAMSKALERIKRLAKTISNSHKTRLDLLDKIEMGDKHATQAYIEETNHSGSSNFLDDTLMPELSEPEEELTNQEKLSKFYNDNMIDRLHREIDSSIDPENASKCDVFELDEMMSHIASNLYKYPIPNETIKRYDPDLPELDEGEEVSFVTNRTLKSTMQQNETIEYVD